jgi:hypothetical protein
MILPSLLMLLSWPLVIVLCWFAIRFALNLYAKKQKDDEAANQ